MGRKEHPFVWYYNKNLHFAELINGWLFRGSDRLTADDISDSDRRILTRKGRNRYKDRFRDLCKSIDGVVFRLLIGVEHQDHVHYAMPCPYGSWIMTVLPILSRRMRSAAGTRKHRI